ncbi:hypothetical protein M422DRAFT_124298, partial [Sphaerobolus stellatus SS14]
PCPLSPSSSQRLKQALNGALAPSTTKGYCRSIRRYLLFCEQEHIPHHLRWPADEFVLCAFAASHVGRTSGATVKGYIAAIRAWHILHNMPWNGSARLSYLLPSSQSPSEPSHFPLRSHLSLTASVGTITLPWTKTTKGKGATLTLAQQQQPTDPLSSLKLHLATSQASASSHLFSYREGNHLRLLTKQVFLDRHSFRIGGTTELLLSGVHPDIVKALGRWSSDVFLVYWRFLSDLAPLHVSNLPTNRSHF